MYLSVNLIDRFLAVEHTNTSNLQLVAVGAMLIASKYEEIYAPEVRDFVYMTDRSYSSEEILKMESQMLSKLKFEILTVSPYMFLKRFHQITMDSLKSFYLAQFLLEFSMLEYTMLRYNSSITAATCLYISRKILKIPNAWPACLISMTRYTEKDLKTCARDFCNILSLIQKIPLKACYLKFSSSSFMEVSKIQFFS